ncbi:hypothetical protein [Paenibacillus harenae]|uniref:hypothetical protein n=1 Tax=Paenibacillus harenae TaxID=306543 RepID=UPI00041BE283|nr:hypothetical protein [Paenibacillus harenae]
MDFIIIILLLAVVYLLIDFRRSVQKKQIKEIIVRARKVRRDLRRSIRKDHVRED